jgi:hypothetical protein
MGESHAENHHQQDIERELRRRLLPAEGRLDALRFAWDCEGDLAKIKTRIQEIEISFADAEMLTGPMKPTAHPRMYLEGFLAGLRDAYELIVAIENRDEAEASTTATQYSIDSQTTAAVAEDQSDYPSPASATPPTPPTEF